MASNRCPVGLSAIATCAIGALAIPASAQEIEPCAYSNAPVGVNFLVAGYAYTRGGLAFDSATRRTSATATTCRRAGSIRTSCRGERTTSA